MFKALFYKEWSKTKRTILLTFIIFAGAVAYAFINTAQLFRVDGATQTWANIILKDMPLVPSIFSWLPLLAGLFLGFAQFIPEMVDKRLKLTLHLPLPENKILSSMLIYGVIMLIGLFVLTYAGLLIGFSFYYPCEVIFKMIWQTIPPFMAGIAAYLLVGWICLEPVWKQRILNAIIAISTLALFSIGAISGAYISLMPYLIIVVIICFILPFYSTARFKDGAQS